MKLFQHSLRMIFGALLVLMLATACSGGGGHNDSADGSTPPSGDTGNNGGGAKACTQQFNPDLAAAGDDCTPSYNQFCPDATSPTVLNDSTVGSCDGVTVTQGSVTANGLTSNYEVLTPTSGGSNALVISLHWSNGNGASMANHMRMSELAKARNVTVVLPTAPDPAPFRTWGNSVVVPISSRADRVALVDALIQQMKAPAKADKPVIVVGVSGGAVLAYEYACDHAEAIDGVEIVAAEITAGDLGTCAPSRAIATLQVQGTADPIGSLNPFASYANTTAAFSKFLANNGCTDADVNHVSLPVPSGELIQAIDVGYTSSCSKGKNSALVSISGGGHSWPGLNRNFAVLPVDLFGAVTNGFDATLQGYDLLDYLMK